MRLVILLAALLGGCAFQNAIDNGNLLVEQQEYRRALLEYERALRLDPDSGEARGLIHQITPYALNESEADIQADLAKARYEQAMRHVAFIQRYDRPRGQKQRVLVETQLHAHVEALMGKGEMHQAYPLAVRAAKLFPKMQGLDGIFQRLRQHYYAQSDGHAAAGRYADALAALDVIERNEPRMAGSLVPRRQKIRGLWADTVVAKAAKAEASEELGAAAVLYGRAFEIAGRDDDGDAMRRLVRGLRSEGEFLLSLSYRGDSSRRHALSKLMVPRLTAVEGVAMAGGDDDASMIATVNVGPMSCRETFKTSSRSKDYVAGTRQVPNPAYEHVTRDIDDVTTKVNVLLPKVSSKTSQVSQLEQRVKRCNRRLQKARSRGDDRRTLPDCDDIRKELSGAKSELSSLQSQLSSAESELDSLTSQRSMTPRTLSEEIIETFTYDVRHHKRRCAMHLTAALEPAWTGVESHKLAGKSATSDDSHPGYSQYGIVRDPLSYPNSDSDLIAIADTNAANGLLGLIRRKVGGYYHSMTDRALVLESTDRVAAVDMFVAIVAAGRTHLDQGRVRKIGARLKKTYGLTSIDTLRK